MHFSFSKDTLADLVVDTEHAGIHKSQGLFYTYSIFIPRLIVSKPFLI